MRGRLANESHLRQKTIRNGAIEDTYAAIDPLSKEFDYESVAFQANGSPTALNANPGGNPTFALRPDQNLPRLKPVKGGDHARWVPLAELEPESLFEDHFFIIQNFLGLPADRRS